MNNSEYIKSSLELHLFFDRIMKEHSLFLNAAFMERDKKLKEVAGNFQKFFEGNLKEVVSLADGNISRSILEAGEIVTKDTLKAENKTSELTGASIDTDITNKELTLRSGSVEVSEELINKISSINKRTIPAVDKLIEFKNDILNSVLACKMYTTNYPLLITHIMNEAKMYHTLLQKLESRAFLSQSEIYEQEIFWNNIMKEHAEFIRGLLDPSEEDLILTADRYADEFKNIMEQYKSNPNQMTNVSLNETIKFRDFKIAGEEGILNCKVKSIIIPLLADHVVREANHFIRILETFNNQSFNYEYSFR